MVQSRPNLSCDLQFGHSGSLPEAIAMQMAQVIYVDVPLTFIALTAVTTFRACRRNSIRDFLAWGGEKVSWVVAAELLCEVEKMILKKSHRTCSLMVLQVWPPLDFNCRIPAICLLVLLPDIGLMPECQTSPSIFGDWPAAIDVS